MSSKAAWVMLVCILQTSQVLCQGNACREPLITGGRYRVEDEQITASSSYSQSYLPHEARPGGMSWCAEAGMGDGAWIQVDFREDVIIQELQIGGDGGIFKYYITQFRIEHGPNSDQLSSILQENSTEPIVFTRPNSPDVSTTVLPTPLTTRVLRIVSVARFGSVPCVYLEAIGCVLPPAAIATTDSPPTTDPTTSDTTPTTSTNSPQQTNDTITGNTEDIVGTNDTMTTTMLASAGNTGAIVGGAVGGVIVVLLLSIIIVVLLVVCMLTKNRSKKTRLTESEVTYTTTGGVRIVDNEIYGDETPPTSPATKHMDINTYESLKTPPTEAIDIANTYDTIGSLNVKASSTPYESVGSPLYTYAKVDTLIKVVLPSNAQPMTFSENSQQSMDSQDDIEKIVINTAYGSLTGANIEADMEASTEKTAINTACGSLMENAAYAGIKSEPEIVRKELIDNPLYDSTQLI